MAINFKLESDVNDYVKSYLQKLHLQKLVDFNEESGMSEYMKEALKGSAKTKSNESLKKTRKKEFLVRDVFDIETCSSYNKGHLKKPELGEKEYDYVTRTTANRGICASTSYIGDAGLNEAGTFSVGLLQMAFFYRENDWYAGQFVRKIKCRCPLDKYTGIYMETVLNSLSNILLAGLVRDVDDAFLNSKIYLPVDEKDEINFQWMRTFVQTQQKELLKELNEKYSTELDGE